MQNVRCGHKQRRQRRQRRCGLLQTIEEGAAGGCGVAGRGDWHCDCDSVAHAVDCLPPLSRVSIKTQQFADFLFSNHDASQPSPSPSPSSPLFIHNVNTDKKLLNHCNTKPTLASCYTLQLFRLRASSNFSSGNQLQLQLQMRLRLRLRCRLRQRAFAMIYAAQILEIQSVYAKY